MEKLEKAIEYIASHNMYDTDFLFRNVMEILNPPDPKKFLECDTCRAKPGMPQLCKGCLHNRSLIEDLQVK